MRAYPSQPVVFEQATGILLSLLIVWALVATALRMVLWYRTPSPLPIPLTPAPRSKFGVFGRLLLELFVFRALARANPATWIASILFHYGLLFVLLMHLRFLSVQLPSGLVPFIRFSGWAAMAMILGLVVLLIRRIVIDRLRYISAPSDYLHLVLLLAIAGSGVVLKRIWPTDLFGVGEFLRGVLRLNWQSLPADMTLYIHIALVAILLFVFPISKLVHGIGIVFSPTLNQSDKARQSPGRSERS